MDQLTYSRVILASSLALILMACLASAYTISRTRTIYTPPLNSTITAPSAGVPTVQASRIPARLILDADTIKWVMDCKSRDGGVGYQSGYSDACDDIRARLGLQISRFRAAPSAFQTAPASKYSVMFPINAYGYFPINASVYQFEIMQNGSRIWPFRNATISEIRVYSIKRG